MANEKMYTLKSSDGETFSVEEAVAQQCQTIKQMIDDDCANEVIPLPNVTGEILAKVIEYCKQHVKDVVVDKAAPSSSSAESISHREVDANLKAWDAEFVDVHHNILIQLILAANYLNVKNLLDLACQAIADIMMDLSVEEIRDMFGIENDFTPEEEAAIRDENLWAYS